MQAVLYNILCQLSSKLSQKQLHVVSAPQHQTDNCACMQYRYVIAKDDAVATELLQKHGQPSVTMSGNVSHVGTLQGGSQLGTGRRTSKFGTKLAADGLQVRASLLLPRV